jgi:6-phosphofructokinase 1
LCGQKAVELAAQGKTGLMVTLERKPGAKYKCITGTIPLFEVAIKAKPMPDEFINKEGNFITDAFSDYIKPLIGELPDYVRLKYHKA